MTLYTQADSNRRKTWVFLFIYMGLLLAVSWFISWYLQSNFLLLIAGVIIIIQGFVSLQFSDQIALSVAHAEPMDEKQYPQVYRILENLCIAAGITRPRLYLIDDTAMNAFATGKDEKHAAIAVTSGLISRLNENELAGVLGHELSHIGNNDIRLMSMVMIMAGFIALLSDLFWRNMWFGGGRRRSSDNDSGGGVLMIVGLVLVVLAPIAATLIQLAISRKREFLADANSVLLTRYPEGMISALQKIGGDEEPLEVANKATAHMYFASPLHGGVLLANLFSTHPPIEARIEALKSGSGMKE